MTDKPDDASLFASPQSMGAFGSLPIPELGVEGHHEIEDAPEPDEEE